MASMPFFNDTVFDMARQQFDVVADHIEMPVGQRDRVFLPEARACGLLPCSP